VAGGAWMGVRNVVTPTGGSVVLPASCCACWVGDGNVAKLGGLLRWVLASILICFLSCTRQ
jgi:hypothetical protein